MSRADELREETVSLRRLAEVIRKYGTCAPSALETVANNIDALLTRTEAAQDEGTDYRCECGKLNYRPLSCANCGEPAPAEAAPVVDGADGAVAWRHTIIEPGRDQMTMHSASPDNPWAHWLESHRDKCQYTVTPLYTRPQDASAVIGQPRFFADGPEGFFYAETSKFANQLIEAAGYDRDDWTVTDLHNPTGDTAMSAKGKSDE